MLGNSCLEADVTGEVASIIAGLDDIAGVDDIDVFRADFGLDESGFRGEVGEFRGGEVLELAAKGTFWWEGREGGSGGRDDGEKKQNDA